MDKFRIRKNVPLPDPGGGRAARDLGKWATPVRKLAVGDMFFVPRPPAVNSLKHMSLVCNGCNSQAKKRGIKLTYRTMEMDGVPGVGVWRIA